MRAILAGSARCAQGQCAGAPLGGALSKDQPWPTDTAAGTASEDGDGIERAAIQVREAQAAERRPALPGHRDSATESPGARRPAGSRKRESDRPERQQGGGDSARAVERCRSPHPDARNRAARSTGPHPPARRHHRRVPPGARPKGLQRGPVRRLPLPKA